MSGRAAKLFFLVLLTACSAEFSLLVAQPAEQAKAIAAIKVDNAKIWTQVEAASMDEALNKASVQLGEIARNKYKSMELALEASLPEQTETQKMAKLKVSLANQVITWSVQEKKKPAVYYAFVHVDLKNAQRFVINRTFAGLKNEKSFKWGEGFGPDAEKAGASAKENLISQISQTIESSTSLSMTEQKSGLAETYQTRTKAFSKVTLQGVRLSSPIETPERTYYSVAYISEEDLEKSFGGAKAKVLTAVQEAEKYRELGNIQASLQNYYKAYLYAEGYYTSIPYKFKGQEVETPDVRAGAKAKIDEILEGMTVVLKPAYEVGEELIYIRMEVMHKDVKVSGVFYELTLGGSTFSDKIRGGRGKLGLSNYLPSDKTEMLDFKFGIDISEDLAVDEDLRLFEAEKKIRVAKSAEANFENIFKVIIEANFKGAEVYFQAKAKNIAALSGKWEFGDGEESSELNPKHAYTSDGVYKVHLYINGDTSLSDTKYVYLKDQMLRRTKMEELASAGTAMLLAPVEAKRADTVSSVSVAVAKPDTGKATTAEAVAKVDEPQKPKGFGTPAPTPKTEPVAPVKVDETKIFAGAKTAKAKDVYEEIRYIETWSQLQRVLTKKKSANEFFVGQQKDLLDADGAMVLLVNLNEKTVVDKLVFSENRYMSLKTGQEITDLKAKFAGTGVSVIWVQAIVN